MTHQWSQILGDGDFVDHTVKCVPSWRHADWVVAALVVTQKVDHLGVMHIIMCTILEKHRLTVDPPGVTYPGV